MSKVKATFNGAEGAKRQVEFEFDFGGTVETAVDNFGQDLVYDFYERAGKVRAQAVARDLMEEGKTDEEIQEYFTSWNPSSTRTPVKDPVASITKSFGSLTVDEQAELLSRLKAQLAALQSNPS